ncbi:hypothetical protein [Nocardioides jejuensis]|uniref:Uncharacterized protein n=1 Tax=Nocardioides jejuensis TaxID=2502782 RepID=A0A4R1CGS2_9ACTN|nr:hypothetical protein [Nocardioides jejuensis]TCJ29917.1 hypothetical protein EPD65_06360 [Nocardioides jejuensis]
MNTEPATRAADAPDVVSGPATTLLMLAIVAYVVIGILWMDATGAEPTSTLTILSIFQFLWAILFWPLHLIGIG